MVKVSAELYDGNHIRWKRNKILFPIALVEKNWREECKKDWN